MLEQPPIWLIVVAFVCAIGPLVFFHELGHYLVGRLFGVGAETFSIGFGREVAGWTDRQGTRWKVGWLPLGGYVRFVGDASAASEPAAEMPTDPRSFAGKPVWQRFLVVLAGPMANFLLAIVIFVFFFAAFGVPRTPNVVRAVVSQSAAASIGIQPGDRIEAIAGQATGTFEDIQRIVALRPGEVVTVRFTRDGQEREASTKLGVYEEVDRFGQKYRMGQLGFYATQRGLVTLPPAQLLPEAVNTTWNLTRVTVEGLWQILTGRRSVKELGGPLKMAQVAGQQASLGLFQFVSLLALFSINLGFINLLPVPMLDGGHLLFYSIEAVRRRPVSAQAQEWAFRGGLALLLALMLFTTVNDLGSFGLWEGLGRLIG
ncbi:RIP metalloprotease RseP [Sphingomonas sabuli]|uniref:Zinc metalloprotease n=1 Tax=Sphingomonas sabuli TaxID=2764186 RepID=A0A7G9L3L7_9SPHN|nr:RIP metalloprotease RseP [Sphingomonas sabuli]QNM83216.1 RIP metalloprotease RseP [Sphingomonas sabuli]